ncbi:MAG TPA: M1 family aminopeptidase [Alphaproteobacteria bacterium]|nr:M1 family aminopeptidase [Alphaproteobacteria bacterium]
MRLLSQVTLVLLLAAPGLRGQTTPPAPEPRTATAVYRDLVNPLFDPADVHRVRDVSIDREDLHIVLIDGVISLTRTIDGHVTGAVFEGEGDVLLFPPDRAERTSLALFTQSGVLDEKFTLAYLRFFDDALTQELTAGFRPEPEPQQFIDRWSTVAGNLASLDGLALLQAMTSSPGAAARYLHLRVAGSRHGVFDVYFDPDAREQISVGQSISKQDVAYYDSWASFPMRSVREASKKSEPAGSAFEIHDYLVRARVSPPTDLSAEAEFTVAPSRPGQRTIVLHLSRYLKVSEVRANGQPVEFIQNEALDGSELARAGNDLIAIVLPAPLQKDKTLRLAMKYAGPVMFDAGQGLMLVGSRGSWYPNYGAMLANYDLTFTYPADWTLVATGKQVSHVTEKDQEVSRFVTEEPILHAGFNLGKFETARASLDGVTIDAYAARNVEKDLAKVEARAGKHPDPTKEVERISQETAATAKSLSEELGAFPYSHLEVTQLPALLSQGWPGLIYLSSTAYLSPEERKALRIQDPFAELLLSELMLAHETAHQWWGDAVDGASYRDEWMIEALANYSALIMLERRDPEKMKVALQHYRNELLKPAGSGIVGDAGPVTLGTRLSSSKFPNAFEPVVYGRGTWLIHMLRTMLRQASGGDSDALFFSALKKLLASSPSHKISTRDLQTAMEQVLPPSLKYEGQKSLDWFFDSWVNGSAIPQFKLENLRLIPSGAKLVATGIVRENQTAPDMVTALPVYAVDQGGRQHFVAFVFVDEENTEFKLTVPAGTKDLLLDPMNTVLRR